MHIRSAIGVALAALVVMITALVAIRPASASSRWGADYFPNVTLTTQDGKQVRFYDDLIKGKIVAIDLIYTQCKDSCPLETARLRQVQRMLGDRVGKDIFFYSISIDPEHDTPEVLHDYAEMYNAGPGWLFLTGTKSDVELLGKKLGLYNGPTRTRDGHTPALLIGNEATGQWMKNSATDNPRFLSIMLGQFIDSYRNRQAAQELNRNNDYAQVSHLELNDPGQYLFATHCAACHSVGHGDKIGPDLAGITQRRDQGWLSRFIASPDKLLDEHDPVATKLFQQYKGVRMPNLRLGEADVAALIAFLNRTMPANTK